jgi:hypothetical protein
VPLFDLVFIDRLLPQIFPFSRLELLCALDQEILVFATTAIRREDEKGQLLHHAS